MACGRRRYKTGVRFTSVPLSPGVHRHLLRISPILPFHSLSFSWTDYPLSMGHSRMSEDTDELLALARADGYFTGEVYTGIWRAMGCSQAWGRDGETWGSRLEPLRIMSLGS